MKQLRITSTTPMPFGMLGRPLVSRDQIEGGIQRHEDYEETGRQKVEGEYAVLHGELEDIAGYDAVVVIDGDIEQLAAPEQEQDISFLLPERTIPCKTTLATDEQERKYYQVTLK